MAVWFVGYILQRYRIYSLYLASNWALKAKTLEKNHIYHNVKKLVLMRLFLITS